jgi:uncharacterized protein involved in exopolysaccharide biosynthesis/Mrp family chromosome partitioning ATPase
MVQAKIKYLDILWFHRWFALTMFLIVVAFVGIGSSLLPRVYKVDAEIYIAPRPTAVTGDSGTSVTDYDYRMLNNQVEILHSDMVASRAVEYILDELGEKFPVSKGLLQSSLNIQKKEYTSIITLGLTGAFKPEHLQTMMRLYLKAYQDTLADINSNKSKNERAFLSRQLEVSQRELETIAKKIEEFQSSNETYNLDTQVNQLLSIASRLDEQAMMTNAEISAIGNQVASARRQLHTAPEYINLMARIERDPEAGDLRRKIITQESERAQWASKLTDSHPKMIAYDREITRLKSLLENRLKSFAGVFRQKLPETGDGITTGSNLDLSMAGDIINAQVKLESLRARAKTLNSSQQEIMGMLRGVPRQTFEHLALKNRFELAEDKVKVLQRRLDEATLMQEVSKAFTKVETLKQPTLPSEPIKPNIPKNMIAAFLGGICLALCSIFVRATFDPMLRWPFQVRGLLPEGSEQNIFTLPSLPSKHTCAAMLEKTNFTVPEPYKRLIIHLENLSKTDSVRRVGLIPVSPFGECNITTVALSLYLTELSNKIMLIDTDFTPHSVTGLLRTLRLPISAALQAGPGLSDYLSGDTEDFLDIVYPLGKTVYGSFIPAGDPVHDTGFQFSHRNLGQLEENLSPNYNFVLYALPSVEQSYDAIAVSRTLDGVLLIAHPGVTSLEQIQGTIRELASVDCRVLGILVQPLKQ